MFRSSMAVAVLTATLAFEATASSHREAPQITRLPTVDATDFYMFMDYSGDKDDHVVFLANYYPLQDAYGGPNYFTLDPNAIYEIHVDNTGDGVEDVTFQFKFSQALGTEGGVTLPIGGVDVDIPLKNFGNVDNDGKVNFKESYSLTMIKGDRREGLRTELGSFDKPLDNIGEKSFADYEAYANGFIKPVTIPGCSGGQVFVGQRKDPFVVNLGKTFDLVNYTPILSEDNPNDDANDDLSDKNVTTLALSVHKDCVIGEGPVIGGWTTASLQQAKVLNPDADFVKPEVNFGAYTQVSRLGMPLVNEVVIGLSNKDKFNASEPVNDAANFAPYVTNPTLPALIDVLFGSAFPEVDNIAPNNFPRTDLITTFLTGFEGVNKLSDGTLSEMVRLRTDIKPTSKMDQSNFGVVAGDLAGFPNGRRPGDDVVDIALRVVMGALCHPVDLDGDGTATDELDVCEIPDGQEAKDVAPAGTVALSDLAPVSAMYFNDTFPFLKAPLAGSVSASVE